MLPYITVFGYQISTYGLMAMLGLVAAYVYIKLAVPAKGTLGGHVELTMVWGIVGAFTGAKAAYLLRELPELRRELPRLFSDTKEFLNSYLFGGFIFYGGLAGALAAALLYWRKNALDCGQMSAYMLPVIPLIHGFGRIGCFCAGCCYGIGTSSPLLGLKFSASAIAPNDCCLVPVQLYEAAFELLMFIFLLRRRKGGAGGYEMLFEYLVLYSTARFMLEFLRGDPERGFILGLSTSQLLALVSLAGAAVFRLWLRRRGRA